MILFPSSVLILIWKKLLQVYGDTDLYAIQDIIQDNIQDKHSE